jgi:predicted RNase H-like nuclease
VYFVGVDLAWGDRRPTGVAAVDADGSLCWLGTAGSDDDIHSRLEPFVGGPCIVAFDAPLVVPNSSGKRPCEAALDRDFRRFDAGTHPTNTGLAWFADGGRAARLSSALKLDLDPRSSASRKALEVYPHAASIALFGLAKTLKYKQKPGRDFAGLRSELLRLMDFVEGLDSASPSLDAAASPQWRILRTNVVGATRKSQLRRAEDPVDAVVCAYIARYAAARPTDVTVYGDTAGGCITTPTVKPVSGPGF